MRSILLLALAAVLISACADEPAQDATPAGPTWITQHPENAHPYADKTLARFGKLVEGDGWRDPAWNEQRTLEATHEKTGLVFVVIPGTGPGGFLMGSPDSEDCHKDDETQHRVTVGAFLLCKTECTQRAWDRIGGEDERIWKELDLPIEEVSWTAASAWCRKVGLRLPSEAEWEYGCRAGTTEATYAGRLKIVGVFNVPALGPIAWYGGNSGVDFDRDDGWDTSRWIQKQHPHTMAGTRKVGQKVASPWGLHDMLGNVSEFCADPRDSGVVIPPFQTIQKSEPAPQYRTTMMNAHITGD